MQVETTAKINDVPLLTQRGFEGVDTLQCRVVLVKSVRSRRAGVQPEYSHCAFSTRVYTTIHKSIHMSMYMSIHMRRGAGRHFARCLAPRQRSRGGV